MRKQLLLLASVALTQAVFSQTDSGLFAAFSESRTASTAGDPLFNGKEHINYHPSIEGIPYFETKEWQKGTLVFHDIAYKDVFLKYDLVADEVVVRHINGFTAVVLFTPRVQSFTLHDKRFIYLPSADSTLFKPGIYQEICKGNLSLYAKRSSYLEETIVSNALLRKFIENDWYYVLKDGKFFPVKKEKALMELMGERKKEIKAWMKTAGIKFKSDVENALTKIIEHYNQISH